MGERLDLRHGDSAGVLRSLPAESVDALVTDPPAGISFMGKMWDHDHGGRDNWIEAFAAMFKECLRVLKPGAHGLVWALPRTSHWTATALEDAGFEIRDVGVHLFGSGFPKSLDVSKAIDKAAGAEREVVGTQRITGRNGDAFGYGPAEHQTRFRAGDIDITAPATDAAREWSGWGTALKPASEHWILVRKPLDGTVAANVLAHGTGALNIDGCRIAGEPESPGTTPATPALGGNGIYGGMTRAPYRAPSGRWPANLTLDKEAAALLDEQSGELPTQRARTSSGTPTPNPGIFGVAHKQKNGPEYLGDTGGASRFFYVAKPSRAERDIGCEGLPAATGGEATGRADGSAGTKNPRAGAGRGGGARNIHPTVKPVDLMRWLCRLVTPPGGLVLDPFMGSGTTGVACSREGFRFLGIEREAAYFEIAKRRIVGDAPLLNRAEGAA